MSAERAAAATPGPGVLVVAPAWVGDMVMAHVLVQILKARQPAPRVGVLAPPATAPLASRMPGVDAVHVLAVGHGEIGLRRRWQQARALRAFAYDQAIVLPNSHKSAWTPWFAGIPLRTGWHGEFRHGVVNDRRLLDAAELPRMVDRFAALGFAGVTSAQTLRSALAEAPALAEAAGNADAAVGIPVPRPRLASEPAEQRAVQQRLGLDVAAQPPVVLCPGAEFGPAKRWPVRHFATVAQRCLARGDAVWLLGGGKDQPLTGAIAAAAPGALDLGGRTSLAEAVDLIALARVVVSNDSGLLHVAAALGRSVVGLYGSSSPDFTPPLGEQAVVLAEDLPCRPCFARTCPLGHLRCLEDLSPDRVMALL